jgi:hypothetical protein
MSAGAQRRSWLAAALVLCIGGTRTAAGELTELQRAAILAEAQEAYDRGVAALRTRPETAREAFETATARFSQLVDDGLVNGRLHYNLANAHLQAGNVGRAILYYRAAEALIPGDPKLRHNLQHARSLVRSRIAPSGGRALASAFLGWHTGTSLHARLNVFLAAWLAFWVVLGVHLFTPRPWWRWLAAGAVVIWLASGASVAADVMPGADRLEGVVLVDDVVVRKGNGEGFDPQFEEALHQGVEFRVLEQRPPWLHIELANDKTGWIRTDQAGLIS